MSLQIGHLLTMEYFWGLELVRPVLLWALPAAAASRKERIRDAARAWLPYLAVYAGFLAWRMFIFDPPGQDPNALALLELYQTDPWGGLLHSFNIVVRDLLHMVYKTWTTGLGPSLIDANDRFLIVSWGWAAFAGAWTLLILGGRRGPARFGVVPAPFYARAIPIGAFALVVSLLPSWMTDNEITAGMFSSRFSLPAMAGSSLFLTGVFDLVLRRTHYKHILIAALVLIAAGVHLRSANDFRWAWIKQERFFRQLSQRAPALEHGTAIFSDGAIFPYTAGYPTASALNTIYPLEADYPEQSYWFFELDDDFPDQVDRFDQDIEIEGGLRNLWFLGSSLDGLVIYYEPDTGSCLRVLEPGLAGLPFLPELTAGAAAVSNIDRIRMEANFDSEALDLIFGAAEPAAWCDLFQRAELARQRGAWDAILDLERQAADLGLEPNERLEWFVFIEAHVRTGDWEGARALILEAVYDPALPQDLAAICSLWNSFAEGDPTDVRVQLACEEAGTP